MVDRLESSVELFLSATNLKDMDTFSKSDPFVVVFQKSPTGQWLELGRTEVVSNNLNPTFTTRLVVKYFFEENQELKFGLYDSDSSSKNLANHDFMGESYTLLANLVAAPGQKLVLPVYKYYNDPKKRKIINKGTARLTVRCEEMAESNSFVTFALYGRRLDKKDFFGSSDPYVIISRMAVDDQQTSWVEVHRTEVIKNNLNPNFKQFTLSVSKLCNADEHRSLKFCVMDWDRHSDDDIIGEFETSLDELKAGKIKEFKLIHPRKAKEKGAKYIAKGSGFLGFNKVQITKDASFLDFIKGGLEISLMVAIDYTGSNGDPSSPSSLHYCGSGINQYASAIQAIGSIVAPYDHDGKYPVWGFGARMNSTKRVEHCFNLNMRPNPEVNGVNGILQCYYQSFQHLILSGPTYFDPILRTACAIAQSTPVGQNYYVLLILTDGVINDMQKTVNTLVRASGLPLSVIIVGVGDANFDAMEFLDADDTPLQDSISGAPAKRDIVQFVPYKKVAAQGAAALAKETLAEVPGQVLSWARLHNVQPKDPSLREEQKSVEPTPPYRPAAAAGPPAYGGSAPAPHYNAAAAPPYQHPAAPAKPLEI